MAAVSQFVYNLDDIASSRNHFYFPDLFDEISDFTQFLIYVTIYRMVASSAPSGGGRLQGEQTTSSREDTSYTCFHQKQKKTKKKINGNVH